ncbi:hypothetical protein NPIL_411981 [Nephila pilipes]|uniref:Transposase n=1 Tax=Nephila pilipes TaxID=299642 RepID=A0A8X6IZ94_NEPPI|nr:hypothetical protein NPIL_411981 [Nephila pilipes]
MTRLSKTHHSWFGALARSLLVRIQATTTAKQCFAVASETLLPSGLPNVHFEQDNAQTHTSGISQSALPGVQILPWPLLSPDLSPTD